MGEEKKVKENLGITKDLGREERARVSREVPN